MSGPEASRGKIGLSIASHSGLPPSRIGALAEAAEQAGFGAVFVAEGHGDALSLCHPVAAATRRARVGTAVANAALRPPVLTAKTAAQLDQAASGRFILSDDSVAAAAAARAVVPRYVLHPAVPRLFGELEGDADLRGVRELILAGDRAGAADQVPQSVADGFVAHGSAAECGARLMDYLAAGVDLPVLFPMPVGGDWGYERAIAAIGGAAKTSAAAAGLAAD